MRRPQLLASLLPHKGHLLFLKTAWKVAEATWRTINGVDVLRNFLDVDGVCREQPRELMPLEGLRISSFYGGDENLFDKIFEGDCQPLFVHCKTIQKGRDNRLVLDLIPQRQKWFRADIIYSMAVKQKIIKQDKFELNVNFVKIWQTIKSHTPDLLSHPLKLINTVVKYSNQVFTIILVLILLGQTVHILNGSERRYINLRHLLIKWIFLLIITLLAQHIKSHTSHDELFVFMCNLFALAMVYPSKFIKNLHLKYFSFSQKKRYEESGDDIAQLQMSLTARILSSVTIFFLNSSRFIITFIHPQHRKKIQEAMRGVNMVIVEEKYFWKMYDSSNRNSVVLPQGNHDHVIQSSGSLGKLPLQPSKNELESRDGIKAPKSPKAASKENVIRAKVMQYIQIPVSSINAPGDKKFTFYRNIQICYYPQTYQLVMTNEQDGKSITHILEELTEESNLMMRFNLENQDEPVFVKFKLKKDYELFLNTIYLSAEHTD